MSGTIRKTRIPVLVLAVLCLWIAWDLSVPVAHDLRVFDSNRVAQIENAMWRSYYDHRPVRLFGQMAELLRE
jgi:hypothetical protein